MVEAVDIVICLDVDEIDDWLPLSPFGKRVCFLSLLSGASDV